MPDTIEWNARVVLGAKGRHHEPILMALRETGFFVSVVKSKFIKDFGNNSLRKVKTDKADPVKLYAAGKV